MRLVGNREGHKATDRGRRKQSARVHVPVPRREALDGSNSSRSLRAPLPGEHCIDGQLPQASAVPGRPSRGTTPQPEFVRRTVAGNWIQAYAPGVDRGWFVESSRFSPGPLPLYSKSAGPLTPIAPMPIRVDRRGQKPERIEV